MRNVSGRGFEERVFRLVHDELESERLGLLPNACTVFHGKGYRSRDRGADIVVDVSIEMFLPKAKDWSVLWAWECKDYRNPVGVEDIEEFWAKLQQIGGANVKGGVAITSALRSGALNFARSKGIAVIRVLPDDQVHWVLNLEGTASLAQYHAEKNGTVDALTKIDFVGENHQIFGEWKTVPITGWVDLVKMSLPGGDPEDRNDG